MGAVVVQGLSSAYWAKSKPADYKGQELDKAIKAWEAMASKAGITIPTSLIPKTPKAAIGEIEGCIKDLQNAITELQKGLATLKTSAAALQAVQGAAAKASADLSKLSKGKSDTGPYDTAISAANAASAGAGNYLSEIK